MEGKWKKTIISILVVLAIGILGYSVYNTFIKNAGDEEYGYSIPGRPEKQYSIGKHSSFLGEGQSITVYQYKDIDKYNDGITNWKNYRSKEIEKKIKEVIAKIEAKSDNGKVDRGYNLELSDVDYDYHFKEISGSYTIVVRIKDSNLLFIYKDMV